MKHTMVICLGAVLLSGTITGTTVTACDDYTVSECEDSYLSEDEQTDWTLY